MGGRRRAEVGPDGRPPRPGGSTLKRLRARWAEAIALGPIPCSKCGRPLEPGEPFDLDHLTPRALGGTSDPDNLWPACVRCNRRAGQHLRAAMQRARRAAGEVAAPPALARAITRDTKSLYG